MSTTNKNHRAHPPGPAPYQNRLASQGHVIGQTTGGLWRVGLDPGGASSAGGSETAHHACLLYWAGGDFFIGPARPSLGSVFASFIGHLLSGPGGELAVVSRAPATTRRALPFSRRVPR